jgi:peptidoglycan/LPS O-acetylase OafA/YrhL
MMPCPADTSVWLGRLTRIWQRGGWIGVDLFFVLSGFLVSGLLFREFQRHASINVTRFLIRRGFKIYPAFWVLLATTVLLPTTLGVARIGVNNAVHLRPMLGEALFVQNYVGGLWDHTWSLGVEEHFYLLLALLTASLLHQWRRTGGTNPFAWLPWICLVVAVVCASLRATKAGLPFSTMTHLFGTHIRIDALFFGVLLSYCWHFKGLATNTRIANRARWLFAAGVLLLMPAFLFELEHTPWLPVAGLTAFYIGSGALLLAMLYTHIPDLRAIRGMATVGTFSYSIYLWHLPVLKWLVPIVHRVNGAPLNWYVYAAVYLAGSVVVGIIASLVIEYPALRLRDRLYPADARSRGRSETSSQRDMPLRPVVATVCDSTEIIPV